MINNPRRILFVLVSFWFFVFISLTQTYAKFVFAEEIAEETAGETEETIVEKTDHVNLPEVLKDEKSKEGYIVNLKDLIKKSKSKIDQVNEKLEEQARTRRNQQREERVRSYYQKAKELYEKGRYEDAKELLDKAVKLTEHPEMKDYVSVSSKRFDKKSKALAREEQRRIEQLERERGYSAKEVEKAYQTAAKLYAQKKYIAAKEEFELVDDMFPDHKATRSYLLLIQQEIEKEQKRLIDEKLRQQTEEARRKKQEWRQKIAQEEQERNKKIREQADLLYREAVQLYKIGQFEGAKEKFKEVEWILPDYKFTLHYLKRLDDEIAKRDEALTEEEKLAFFQRAVRQERLEKQPERPVLPAAEKAEQFGQVVKDRRDEEAQFIYDSAVALYDIGRFEGAKEQFERVKEIWPDFKETERYLAKVQDEIDRKNYREHKSEIRQLYKEGTALFKSEEYVDARNKFEALKKWHSDYKRTNRYLDEITEKLFAQGIILPPVARDVKTAGMREPGVGSSSAVVQQAVQQRRQRFADQAEEKYQQAVKFFNDKNYGEARLKFIQVEALYSSYKDTLDYLAKIQNFVDQEPQKMAMAEQSGFSSETVESKIKQTLSDKFQNEVEEIYTNAVNLYDNQHYALAKERFSQVERLIANYKMTRQYLEKVDNDISKQDKYRHVRRDVPRRETYDFQKSDVVTDRPGANKDFLKLLYKEAKSLYSQKQFERAQDKFLTIQQIAPGYGAVEKYLRKIDQYLEKQKAYIEKDKMPLAEPVDVTPAQMMNAAISSGVPAVVSASQKVSARELAVAYIEAVSLYKLKKYQAAREQFEFIESQEPDYKSTRKYLSFIAKEMGDVAVLTGLPVSPEVIVPPVVPIAKESKLIGLAEQKYTEAKELYESGQYVRAKKIFEEIEFLFPKFRDAALYIEVCEKAIKNDIRAIDQAKVMTPQQARQIKLQEYNAQQDRRVSELKAQEASREQMQKMEYQQFRQALDERYANEEQLRDLRQKRMARIKNEIQKRQITAEEQVTEEMGEPLPPVSVPEVSSPVQQITSKEKVMPLSVPTMNQPAVLLDEEHQEQPVVAVQEVPAQQIEAVSDEGDVENAKSAEGQNDEDLKSDMDLIQEDWLWNEFLNQKVDKRVVKENMQEENALYRRIQRQDDMRKKAILEKEQQRIMSMLNKSKDRQNERWRDDVDEIYKAAIMIFKQGDYDAAKIKFRLVERLWPGYRAAARYLERCEAALSQLSSEEAMMKNKEYRSLRAEFKWFKKRKLAEMRKEKEAQEREERRQREYVEGIQRRIDRYFGEAGKQIQSRKLEEASRTLDQIPSVLEDELLSEEFRAEVLSRVETVKKEIEQTRQVIVEEEAERQRLADMKNKQAQIEDLYREASQMVNAKKYFEAESVLAQAQEAVTQEDLAVSFIETMKADLAALRERLQNQIDRQAEVEAQKQKEKTVQDAKTQIEELYFGNERLISEGAYDIVFEQLGTIRSLLKTPGLDERFVKSISARVEEQRLFITEQRQKAVKQTPQERKHLENISALKTDIQIAYQNVLDARERRDWEDVRENLSIMRVSLDDPDLSPEFKAQMLAKMDEQQAEIFELMLAEERVSVPEPQATARETEEKTVEPQIVETVEQLLSREEELDRQIAENQEQKNQDMVDALAKEQEQIRKILEERQKEDQKRWNRELKELYNSAVKLYRSKDYQSALTKFSALQRLSPGYKSTERWIKKSQDQLDKEGTVSSSETVPAVTSESDEEGTVSSSETVPAVTPEIVHEEKPVSDEMASREEARRIKNDAELKYKELVQIVRRKNLDEGFALAEELKQILENDLLDDRYAQKMWQKVSAQVDRLDAIKIKNEEVKRLEEEKRLKAEEEQRRAEQERIRLQEEEAARKREEAKAQFLRELRDMEMQIKKEQNLLDLERAQLSDQYTDVPYDVLQRESPVVLDLDLPEAGDLKIENEQRGGKSESSGKVEMQADQEPVGADEKEEQLLQEEMQKRDHLMSLIEDRQQKIQSEREKVQQEFMKQLDLIYNRAVAMINKGDVNAAQRLLEELNELSPGYKDADELMKKISQSQTAGTTP